MAAPLPYINDKQKQNGRDWVNASKAHQTQNF